MVVQMHPCRRRGGVWWRREVGSGGEEKQGKGEKNGWWRRKAGEGRKEWKAVGNIRFNSRRCERRLLVQLNTRRSKRWR